MHRHDPRSNPLDRRVPWRLLVALLLATTAACSDPGPSEGDTSGGDVVGDGTTLPDATTSTADGSGPVYVDPKACPGGWGCDCKVDGDCGTGLCLELPDEAGAIGKRCATSCENGICPEGQRCRELGGAEGLQYVCVDGRARLCDPCKASADCRVFGLHDSACVRYGAAGNFCGVACQGDADCGEGYRCTKAASVDGDAAMRCVRVADAGAPQDSFGTCACSAGAIAAKASTTCYAEAFSGGVRLGLCQGTRACGADGLSACSAKVPQAEACNSLDDDCDGLVDEGTCDDGNPCTTDSCGGDAGCTNEATTAPCDADGTVCTAGDACSEGKCVKGAALDCDDGNPCTVDSCHAVLGCRNIAADGKACDDGNACSTGEACLAGACAGAKAKDCDDGKACTIDACDPKDGSCTNAVTTGLLCDDGDACTHTDLCAVDGSCVGKTVTCDDGDACTSDSCDSATGCKSTTLPDGSGCDDGNLCTGTGTCSAGTCLPGPAKVCTAPGPCYLAACFAKTGACLVSQRPDGVACDDGDACTTQTLCNASGQCLGGAVDCDDGDACTADACDKAKGCVHTDQPCGCASDAECDDNNPCTDDSCLTASKKCSNAASSKACDDGDACTENDACGIVGNGPAACVPGKAADCDDNNPCTDDACDTVKGCTHLAKADGTGCDDGDTCTQNDQCSGGACKGNDTCSCAKDADCDDGNDCTADACDTGTSTCKTSVPLAKGATCSDGDVCTEGDGCDGEANASCTAGSAKDCDDKDACTVDSCDASAGCKHDAATDGTSCDDGDDCSTNDACVSGSCKGSIAPVTVSTFAGSGSGYTDAKGELAQFKVPTGVLYVAGKVYVADIFDHRVRVIDADTNVTTLAGQGVAGETDDTGTDARFYGPAALAVSADASKLYVVDSGSHKIRVVTVTGAVVSTLAGSNTPGSFGQPPKGGYADGQGAAAMFNGPMGIATLPSGFVVADAGNHRLRSLAADGTVGTLAGTGTAGGGDGAAASATFNQPTGVATGAGGAIYVSDRGGHRIRRLSGGNVVTIAGDGTDGTADGKGASAQFSSPWGLWVEPNGGLVVADSGSHRLRVVSDTGEVVTLAGSSAGNVNGTLDKATFDGPAGITGVGGKIWIATQTGFRVRLLDDPYKTCNLP